MPPIYDAAPGETGASVRTWIAPESSTPPIDCDTIYTLRAALVSLTARKIVERVGPDLFTSRPEQVLAKMILTDRWSIPATFTARERKELEQLIEALERCRFVLHGEDDFAVRIVARQAERRYGPLLASELRWAAGRVGLTPLPWLQRRVDEAFDIARGERPLDVADGWTGDAEEVAA